MVHSDIQYYDKYNILSGYNTKFAILSGSFNPLHRGHLAILHYAQEYFKDYIPLFEITKLNCDKGLISEEEISKRIKQFDQICRPVVVTESPNFVEKAKRFPTSMFCVGTDTLVRIDSTKYYYHDEKERKRCHDIIARCGCSFLVFERDNIKYEDVENTLSPELNVLCKPAIGYSPINISSTQLRGIKK